MTLPAAVVLTWHTMVASLSLGLTGRVKLLCQFLVGLAVGSAVYLLAQSEPKEYSTQIVLPFFKQVRPELGLLYIVFAVLLLLGLILIKADDGVAWLAIHIALIVVALTLARHNRLCILKKW